MRVILPAGPYLSTVPGPGRGGAGARARTRAVAPGGAVPAPALPAIVPGTEDRPRTAPGRCLRGAPGVAYGHAHLLPAIRGVLVIRFDNVSKTYPKQSRPALRDVSLEVERGEFVFLVGSSGSGKSTFLRLILREERASHGQVHVLGKDLSRLSNWKVPQMRRQLGNVFQDFRLLPNKTVAQNVAFAQEVIGKSKGDIRKSVPQVLDLVGLGGKEDRMPGELSGGEQQRVAIARAFVNRPKLLIADEPTGNLDPQTSVGIMKLLDRINRTGTTVVMATHDQQIVDQMRKRVIELEKGRLVRDQSRGVYGYQH